VQGELGLDRRRMRTTDRSPHADIGKGHTGAHQEGGLAKALIDLRKYGIDVLLFCVNAWKAELRLRTSPVVIKRATLR
jgi:hypothetical protein